jgi:hypothetical protein
MGPHRVSAPAPLNNAAPAPHHSNKLKEFFVACKKLHKNHKIVCTVENKGKPRITRKSFHSFNFPIFDKYFIVVPQQG